MPIFPQRSIRVGSNLVLPPITINGRFIDFFFFFFFNFFFTGELSSQRVCRRKKCFSSRRTHEPPGSFAGRRAPSAPSRFNPPARRSGRDLLGARTEPDTAIEQDETRRLSRHEETQPRKTVSTSERPRARYESEKDRQAASVCMQCLRRFSRRGCPVLRCAFAPEERLVCAQTEPEALSGS